MIFHHTCISDSQSFTLSGETWEFRNGRLDHPCGYLTSWFRFDVASGSWLSSEWGEDLDFELRRRIVKNLNWRR